MQTLIEFLANLNSCEVNVGIYVNPGNLNEYRSGEMQFENRGILDGWICIGSLESLSFKFQSEYDAFKEVAPFLMKGHRYCIDALYEAYQVYGLHGKLQEKFGKEIEELREQWALESARSFVEDELPLLLRREAEAYGE